MTTYGMVITIYFHEIVNTYAPLYKLISKMIWLYLKG